MELLARVFRLDLERPGTIVAPYNEVTVRSTRKKFPRRLSVNIPSVIREDSSLPSSQFRSTGYSWPHRVEIPPPCYLFLKLIISNVRPSFLISLYFSNLSSRH
jgi:hypothetical protein